MIDIPFTPPAHVTESRLAQLGVRLSELTDEDVRLTAEQCAVKLERGDVLNAILGEAGQEDYTAIVEECRLSLQQAGQERWVSGSVPDYARNADVFSWAAHREVARLEPDAQVHIFDMAVTNGDTSQRAVRELVREWYPKEEGDDEGDGRPRDLQAYARDRWEVHFGGRLDDSMIDEIAAQTVRIFKDWEKVSEEVEGD